MITHGELFAGISGFGKGFEQAGIETVWHVEIDNRCQEVLRHHYPGTLLLSDVLECGKHNLPSVDIISFGTPCQDLSVAGKREGLKGERSGLFFEGIRVVDELQPTFAVWENVPGAFSSNSGRDFAAVLAAFRQCGARDIAWRVLDAQYCGVAQRRRRVFVVADFRGERAAEILFESTRSPWDSAPSRETGQEIAGTIAAGAHPSGFNGRDAERGNIVLHALSGNNQRNDPDGEHFVVKTWNLHDDEKGDFSVSKKPGALQSIGDTPNQFQAVVFEPRYVRNGRGAPDTIVPPLKAQSGQTGKGDSAPVVAYGFSQESDGSTVRNAKDLARPITGRHGDPGVVAFTQNTRDEVRLIGGDGAIDGALPAQPGMKQQNYLAGFGVRRLTPLECERLQGFPDGWTAVKDFFERDMSDSARYRMLGNAVAVPVAQWIGRRIVQVSDEV
jgi:DNA (cytosine-5)-methyltransferase 1